jgi:hypothetical protein
MYDVTRRTGTLLAMPKMGVRRDKEGITTPGHAEVRVRRDEKGITLLAAPKVGVPENGCTA